MADGTGTADNGTAAHKQRRGPRHVAIRQHHSPTHCTEESGSREDVQTLEGGKSGRGNAGRQP